MSRLARLLVAVAALGIGAALVAIHGGCSRKATPTTATVSGKVTFQGEPLADGLIVFVPDPDRGGTGKPARGDLGPDGTFQLTIDGETMIPPGWYRVAIAPAPRYERGSVRDRHALPIGTVRDRIDLRWSARLGPAMTTASSSRLKCRANEPTLTPLPPAR